MKSFIKKFIQSSRQQQTERGQGIVEYLIILSLVGLAVVLIVNLVGPAISNTFADFVERAPVAPPELVGFTRVPPTPTATLDPNPILTILYPGTSCTGTVDQNPAPPYVGGQTVTLTAVPDPGCQFSGWGDDLSGTNNPETIYLDSSKTVSVNFTQIRYSLTINITGAGTVQRVPDQATFLPGSVVVLTAVPDSGLVFLRWGGDLSPTDPNPVTLLMDSNKTVLAFFQASCYTLTTSASPASGGTIAANPGPDCSGEYTHGVNVILTASPNPGYLFSAWSGDVSGSSNPSPNLAMTSNRSVIATFTQIEYTLTTNVTPAGGGTIAVSPNQPTYHYNDIAQLTVTTNPGYTFTGWSGSASGSTNPYPLTFDGNETVTANFSVNCYTLTLGVLPANSGTINRSPASSGGCPSGQYTYNTLVTLTANPANGYIFQNWSGGISGTNSTAAVTIVGNTNITANFQQCYALNVTINPSAGGTVNRNPAPNCTGGTTYSPGSSVALTAVANSGYTFSSWSGDATGSNPSVSVTMNATRNVTANFSGGNQVLFVVGNTNLNGGDTAVRDRLIALGYTVTVVNATASQTSDATGKRLVVISSTCNSGDVNTKFRNVAVPVMTWENALYDDMNMTQNGGGDHGIVTGQQRVDVIAGHPLAGGLSGNTRVNNNDQIFSWGVPNGNAVIAATVRGDSSRPVIFGYAAGVTMVNNFTAPARRVGFFLENDAASDWRNNGITLFDAAVNWAVGNS